MFDILNTYFIDVDPSSQESITWMWKCWSRRWKFVERICLTLLNENELKEVEFFSRFFNMVHSVEWNGEDVMN